MAYYLAYRKDAVEYDEDILADEATSVQSHDNEQCAATT